MGQKVIYRFWWESVLSSASRNHLTTFCRPFVSRAYAREGFGVNPPLSLICYKKFITCTQDINCFCILFAC